MPMLDVYIPEGTFAADRETALINQITEILIRHEGFDPADPTTRSVSWVFLHRPAGVYVARRTRGRAALQGGPLRPGGTVGRWSTGWRRS